MNNNFDFDAFFGGQYIKADDIDEERGLVLTVQDYSVEEVGPDREAKCLLEFQELEKKLVLNVTNGRVLGDLFGKDADQWIGKRIKLITQPTTFAGRTTVGVRIYPKPLKAAVPQPVDEFEEELPF